MAPLARVTTAAVGVEVKGRVDEGVGETGDEVPLRHQVQEEKKRAGGLKLKTAAQASNQSHCFYLPASRQRQQQSLRKEQETPQEMRQSEREEGVSYHWALRGFSVCTSESDQESVQLAFDCWQMCRLSL